MKFEIMKILSITALKDEVYLKIFLQGGKG